MNKRNLLKKIISTFTAAALAATLLSGLGSVSAAGATQDGILMNSFTNPKDTSKLMARFWFPDAGVGYDADGDGVGDEISMVEDMINEFVEAGFAGVELTMLSDNSDIFFDGGNELASKIDWGTDAWSNIIGAAVDTANNCGRDFLVDVTITAHWPMVINTIDPNDDAQQQELVSTYQKLTAADLGLTRAASSDVYLDLPAMRTKDTSNYDFQKSTFLFTDKLVTTAVARVDSVKQGGTPVLDFDSMFDITDIVRSTDGYAAGIPSEDWTFMQLVEEDGYYDWNTYTADQAEEQLGVKLLTEPVALDPDDPGRLLEDATVTVTASGFSNVVTITYGDGTVDSFSTGGPMGNVGIGTKWFDEGTTVTVTKEDDKTYYTEAQLDSTLIPVVNADFFGEKRLAKTGIMADTQMLYYIGANKLGSVLKNAGVDLSSVSDSEEIQAGDYVLVNSYRRGTGQIQSGGRNITMEGKTYAIDYFDKAGAEEVTNYWDEHILPHIYTRSDGSSVTIRELMEQNGGTIFEDSIELSKSGSFWSQSMLDSFEKLNGYDVSAYVGVIAGMQVDDTTASSRLNEDYSNTLGTQYLTDHSQIISDWAKGFGYAYRAQGHGLNAVDAGASALTADIPESDNGSDGNGTRTIASAVNINPDQHYLSMEALTFGTGFTESPSWYYCLNTLNRYYSEGVNRVILHGTPFKKTYNDYDKEWPGWTFMDFMAWNARQTWWDDVDVFTDYIERVQGILQDGTAKIPVAILKDAASSNLSNGKVLTNEQELVGSGYTYNIITKGILESEYAVAATNEEGKTVLSPEAEYQAIVMKEITKMSVPAMEKLVELAKAGLVIIDNSSEISKVYGSSLNGEDEQIQSLFAELQQQESYISVSNDEEILSALKANVDSGVSIDAKNTDGEATKWLEATRFDDPADGSKYYLFYNESDESAASEQPGSGPLDEASDITATVTLKGNGAPYRMDPAIGKVTAITDYATTEDGVTFTFDILEGDLCYFVVTDNEYISGLAETEPEKTIQQTVSLGGDTVWTLDLESWGPDNSAENTDADGSMIDPTLSEKITLSDLQTALMSWNNLSLSEEQLATLGVESASKISGIGTYQVTVDVPDYGEKAEIGAVLHYSYDVLTNNLTQVLVTNANGTTDVYGINPTHSYLDLGTVLTPGENTITIKVCGDLNNRKGGRTSLNGLTDASLDLYTVGDAVVQPVDTAILDKVILAAEQAIESGEVDKAIESVQVSFMEAYNAAKEVAANPTSQSAVDSAWINLMNEIHKLGFIAGDKSELNKLIAYAESLEMENYIDGSAKDTFLSALSSAQETAADGDALEQDVADAQQALVDGLLGLRYKADKSILQDALAKAAQLDTAEYTAESVAAFNAAYEEANAVNNDDNAAQEDVDRAIVNLNTAIEGLVAVNEKADTGNATEKNGDSTLATGNGNVKTGDTAPIAVALSVLSLAFAGFVLNRKKK